MGYAGKYAEAGPSFFPLIPVTFFSEIRAIIHNLRKMF